METKAKLNELGFKSSVKKLEISVGTKELKDFEFELAFEREFYYKYEHKVELFGELKKVRV